MSEENTKKNSEFILVRNDLGHYTGTGLRYREKAVEKGVKGQLKTKSIVLFVGWNSIKRDYWKEAMKNKNFKNHLDFKKLVVKELDIFELEGEELVEVINGIYDPRFLKILGKKLTDANGKIAAQQRLDSILNPDYENDEEPETPEEEFYGK